MDYVTFTRSEFYELVWSKPMSKLALEYGLSDVGLAKICARYEIPRPGRGYWAQLAAGQKPLRTKLPMGPANVEDQIVLHRAPTREGADVGRPIVNVTEKLIDPHPAVIWISDEAKTAKEDKYGRLAISVSWHAAVCVRRTVLPRALLLADALFKALGTCGPIVEAKRRSRSTDGPRTLVVTSTNGEELWIEIEESREPQRLTRLETIRRRGRRQRRRCGLGR